MSAAYESNEPTREAIDGLEGATLLEFGSPWCGWCRMAQPLVDAALKKHPGVRHVRIADASGRPLGRSFRVKLWPTFVFLRSGEELARLVRPDDPAAIEQALAKIDSRGP
jgi:thioredoxin 1